MKWTDGAREHTVQKKGSEKGPHTAKDVQDTRPQQPCMQCMVLTDRALGEAATALIGSVQMDSIRGSTTVVEITPNSLNVMNITDCYTY